MKFSFCKIIQKNRRAFSFLAIALALVIIASNDAVGRPLGKPLGKVSQLRIMPLGDSITWGNGSTDASGYRSHLYAALTGLGVEVNMVGSVSAGKFAQPENEGHGGWMIPQLMGHIDEWMKVQPEVVLLMGGTNDLIWGPNPTVNIPLNLVQLIDRIQARQPGVIVLVAQITPLNGDYQPQDKKLIVANAGIVKAVQAMPNYERSIFLVDQHTGYPTGAMPDGVHPNDTGYKFMSRIWLTKLKALYDFPNPLKSSDY